MLLQADLKSLPYIKQKNKTAGEYLLQIHHQERYHYNNFRSSGKFGHYTGQAEPAFALAELAFNCDPVNFILTVLLLFLFQTLGVFGCYFLRSAKWRAGKPNTILLAISPILSVTIDLVGMDRFGIESKMLMVIFNLPYQITRLVVVVPTDPVYKTETISFKGTIR